MLLEVKKFLYALFIRTAVKLKNTQLAKKLMLHIHEGEKQLHAKKLSPGKLHEHTLSLLEQIKINAELIYGNNWNYYSDALRPEIAKNFEDCTAILEKLNRPINYLEIGSAQGLSMSLNASLLKKKNITGKLVSLDPYYQDGYVEGAASPWMTADLVSINKSTKHNAARLYNALNIDVYQFEKTSFDGLLELNLKNEKFDYIYIDGYHEKFVPMQDLALCLPLLQHGGIIMLDDHQGWPDISFLKIICDKYLIKVSESWKIIAYQKSGEL